MNRVSPLIKFVVAIAQLNKWLIPLCRKVPEIYIYIYIYFVLIKTAQPAEST